MIYLHLVLFSLGQLARIGAWQAGAEMTGSEELRQRTLRHRRLKDQATKALRAQLLHDVTSLLAQWTHRPRSSDGL